MFGELFKSLFDLITAFLNPVTLFLAGIIALIIFISNKKYKETTYYQITKTPLGTLRRDKGKYGEYLIYKQLRNFETNSVAKFLFNVYIPKENGETTEIDVLMICSKGIFVFESKNYSGWIYGNESQRYWTQVLPKGRGRSQKEKFYNPIMQNRGHIKHLKSLAGEDIPMRSIIAFSERCTLKDITLTSYEASVINRNSILPVVSTLYNQYPTALDTEKIDHIYNILYPFTQVDLLTKQQHIQNIKNNTMPKVTVQSVPTNTVMAEEKPMENVSSDETQAEAIPVDNISTESAVINETPILICPKCNGELVLRTAKRGENKGNSFYGCSNYPKCKYIQEYIPQ